MKQIEVIGVYPEKINNYWGFYYCIKCQKFFSADYCKHYVKHRWKNNVSLFTLEYTNQEMAEMFKPKMVKK